MLFAKASGSLLQGLAVLPQHLLVGVAEAAEVGGRRVARADQQRAVGTGEGGRIDGEVGRRAAGFDREVRCDLDRDTRPASFSAATAAFRAAALASRAACAFVTTASEGWVFAATCARRSGSATPMLRSAGSVAATTFGTTCAARRDLRHRDLEGPRRGAAAPTSASGRSRRDLFDEVRQKLFHPPSGTACVTENTF